MRKFGFYLAIALLIVLPSHAFALSIVYSGLECEKAVNVEDPTPTSIPVQSRFDVIEDVGDGLYRLILSGGLPRFTNNDQNICIDSATAVGFSGIPAVDGLPQKLASIDATGYFYGRDLIIVINSINTDLSASRNNFSRFSTSSVSPVSNTLIYDYNPQTLTFRLKKIIHNRGLVHTSGATNSITPFFETVLPVFFGDNGESKHKILTPLSNIDYVLEP